MTSFLEKHKRHPKLYIDLPSQGKWYNDTICNKVESLPVFGMTAMDEIVLKTPDALFSGEATAQVIQSCVPDILDPWKLVGYDIDYILVAIRIATYGDSIEISSKCPQCEHENAGDIPLQRLLENINNNPIEQDFDLGELNFILHPISFRTTTDFSIESYSLERQILQIENQQGLTRQQKDEQLNELYKAVATLNLKVAVSYLSEINDGTDSEVDMQAIFDFVKNNDVAFYEKLKNTITELTEKWKLPPFEIACNNEDCDHSYKTKLDMDYSNFFGTRSLHSRNLTY